ncbi:MAG: hypothetical protein HUJ29_12890 [Gammaproteobacteria bacterium]|nr:hypothetical protein [Gammaproteobacteria bacterium]
MIAPSTGNAYPSPTSPQMLEDYAALVKQRLAMTQSAAKAQQDKAQKTLDPEITKIFQNPAKTVIDLYA